MDQFARQRHKCHTASQKKRPKKTSPPAEVPTAPSVPRGTSVGCELPPSVPTQHPRMPPVSGVDVAGVDPGLWARGAGPGWRGLVWRLRLGARRRCQGGCSDLVVDHGSFGLLGVRVCHPACLWAGVVGVLASCARPRRQCRGGGAWWRRQLADVPFWRLGVGLCRWQAGPLCRRRRVRVRRDWGRYWRRYRRWWWRSGRWGSVAGWRGVFYYHGPSLRGAAYYGDGCGGGRIDDRTAESVVWKRVGRDDS